MKNKSIGWKFFSQQKLFGVFSYDAIHHEQNLCNSRVAEFDDDRKRPLFVDALS